MERDHGIFPPMEHHQWTGHLLDQVHRRVLLFEGVDEDIMDPGDDTVGQGRGVMHGGGAEIGEGGIQDHTCGPQHHQ